MNPVVFTNHFPARMGLRFSAPVIRATVPAQCPGAYCLFRGADPVYVGRSDHCVRTRLSVHPLLGFASHFTWTPTSTPWTAFLNESAWWHALNFKPEVRNQIHPARPVGITRTCPFCNVGDGPALAHAIRWATADPINHNTTA